MHLRFVRNAITTLGTAALVLVLTQCCAAQGSIATMATIATPGGAMVTGNSPEAAYVDVSGNLFVALGATTSSVMEIPANGSPAITIATGLNTVRGVAADSLGNVYVSQIDATSIAKYPAGGGAPSNIGTIEGRAFLLTLDNNAPANLYVADEDGDRVEKINTSTGAQTVVLSGLDGPKGVVLDSAGDLFVSNWTGSTLTELTAGGTTVQLALQGLDEPYGLAFDQAGDLFVMNNGNGEILEYPVGFTTSTTPTIVVNGLGSAAQSLVLSLRGDLIYNNTAHVYSMQAAAGNFYGTAVGASSAATATAIIYTFPNATTLAATPAVYLSNNAATAQFATSTTSGDTTTCTANKAIAAGGSCGLYVAFVPTQAGPVSGAVNLMSSTGSVLATTLLTGVGDAPVAAFGPGTQSVFLSSGLGLPTDVAVDAGGNVYATDAVNRTVTETTSGGTTTTLGFTGLTRPGGVAVDGSGSVYLADTTNDAVYKLTTGGVQSTIPTNGLNSPRGIAIDGLNNLYIADSGNSRVVRVSASGVQSVVGFTGLSNPAWVAMDFAGDVFVTDSGQVYELSAAGVQSTIATTGIGTPAGIAVSTNGSLYIADSGNNDVYVLPSGGSAFTLASGLQSPSGLALAANGSLYIANAGASQVVLLNRSLETLAFPSTMVNNTSAPLIATVQNTGNAALSYSNFAVTNLSGTGYAQQTPVNDATDCYPSATLLPAALCNVNILFTPTSGGTITGSATSTDNALNVTAAQQTVNLTGTSNASITTAILLVQTTPASGNPEYGQAFAITATVSPASGTGTPTGSITFTVDGVQGSPITLVRGAASTSPTGLVAGSHTIGASYSGDSNYSSSTSNNLPVTITMATPTVIWTPGATQQIVDAAIGSSILDASVTSPAGSIAYTATPTVGAAQPITSSSVLVAGAYTLTATFTPTDTINYNSATVTVSNYLVGCHDGSATGVTACAPTFTDNFNEGYLNSNNWTNSYPSGSNWKLDRPTWMPDVFDSIPGGGLSIRADARSTYFPNGGVTGTTQCDSSSTSYKCYTAGAITTQGSFAQAYGYFEISAQLYPGPGVFPAFWMLPLGGAVQNSAPTTLIDPISEIDIFEGNTTYMDNAWYGLNGSDKHSELGYTAYNQQVNGQWPTFNPTTGYHTYGLAWTPTTLTFYVDGTEVSTYSTGSQLSVPMYLMVDADLGGPGGAPSGSSGFPQFMNIAYVHAYQYNAAQSTGTSVPFSWGMTTINNQTANPTNTKVLSQTVNPGDTLGFVSSVINNSSYTLGGTISGDGPHINLTITDYLDVVLNTAVDINLPTPLGPSSSEGYTFNYTVPTTMNPGVYNVKFSANLGPNSPYSWQLYNNEASARFTVVTQPRLNLSTMNLGYVAGEPQSGSWSIGGGSSDTAVNMAGNMWLAGTLPSSYTTTYYTMLEFDFSSTGTADEYALGLFPSSAYSQVGLFQVGGGITNLGSNLTYNTYVNADGTIHYTIPIGKYITPGTVLTNLLLLSASSAGTANASFNNIRVYDIPMSTSNPLAINSLTMY